MKKLQELWDSLTEPERVALVIMADVVTRRKVIVEAPVKVAAITVGPKGYINWGLKGRDPTFLHPDSYQYLEKFLADNPLGEWGFAELYQKLMAQI